MKKIILISVLVYFLIGLGFSYLISYPKYNFTKNEIFRLGFVNGRNYKIISYWPLYLLLAKIEVGNGNYFLNYKIPNKDLSLCKNKGIDNFYDLPFGRQEALIMGPPNFYFNNLKNTCDSLMGGPFGDEVECIATCVKKPFPLNLLPYPPTLDYL